MSNSSIWPTDRTLSSVTTPGQSEPGSDGNEEVLHIPRSSSITEASPSDCLVSYPGHLLRKIYPSTQMHMLYFAAPSRLGQIAGEISDGFLIIVSDRKFLEYPTIYSKFGWSPLLNGFFD